MAGARLLVADDDRAVRETYAEMLAHSGHEVDTAANGEEAVSKVRAATYDLLLTDLIFPPSDGIAVLKEVKRIRPSMLAVIFSGHATVDNVLRAFRAGAFDFLQKPVEPAKLQELAARALEIREMGDRRRRLAEELENERLKVMQLRQKLGADDPFQKILGNSPLIQGFIDTLREVARTDSTVLLTGESGTGKGLVARTIHEASSRHTGPFVEANCVVYSEGVLHSELFGHERGAFTGAARSKKGRFELARGGSLFLDEIGEIPPTTQLLLLRVLQDRTFERVGGEETLEADVRLLAATNRDLQAAIRQGTFRSDLYYRLNVIPVHLPPLREHPEDVPVLSQHFMASCAAGLGREVSGFSDEAMDAMMRYPWPGNVRELENVIERLVVLSRSGTIETADLPLNVRQGAGEARVMGAAGTLQELERCRIVDALAESGGNKKQAARRLGIHRSTLYAKMRRYGIDAASDDDAGADGERGEERHASDSPTLTATR
jgi:two-component system response regulator HydG